MHLRFCVLPALFVTFLGGCTRSREPIGTTPLAVRTHVDCAVEGEYFPDRHMILDGDTLPSMQAMRASFEAELRAMGEPSLYVCGRQSRRHVYRLLWARSLMSKPMARLTLIGDNSSELELKALDRTCMPLQAGRTTNHCAMALQTRSIKLDRQQTARALQLLKAMPWHRTLAQQKEAVDTDGADWYFEERDGLRYHFADFREPSAEAAELTRLLFWDWTNFLPEDQRKSVDPGFFY